MHQQTDQILVTPQDAEVFFYRAMRYGYASGVKPRRNFPDPGSRRLEYHDGNWRLIDAWRITSISIKSSGITTIYWNNFAVWEMMYWGWYAKVAINTLKQALLYNYSQDLFYGGRGPQIFKTNNHVYMNMTTGNKFVDFGGREYIHSEFSTLGEHYYRGGWLL